MVPFSEFNSWFGQMALLHAESSGQEKVCPVSTSASVSREGNEGWQEDWMLDAVKAVTESPVTETQALTLAASAQWLRYAR